MTGAVGTDVLRIAVDGIWESGLCVLSGFM